MYTDTERPLLLFDGVCNLCNGAVQFIIRHDRRKRFLFASLQSATGIEVARQCTKGGKKLPDSMILLYKGQCYTRSGAALRIACLLGWPWHLLSAGLIVPPFMRNIVYDRVAANRYRWFGKKEECMIPTPELQERFLP